MNDARESIQRGQIYAFLLIPKGTTSGLASGNQPKISFYYSTVTLLPGNLLFRDLKTISVLGSAAVGKTKLSALGKTGREIRTFLQPISVDLHMIGNPWSNYNIYLSTAMVPGVLMLFVFLITPYSIGTELKFGRSKEWIQMAGGNIGIAVSGKFSVLSVLAAEGFGIFAFGLMPSLRMSMSICALWSVLSFSVCGATFPVFAMDSMIEALAQLFPLRHYYMIYQICIFNGFPLSDAYFNILALCAIAALPIFTIGHIKKAMLEYIYIP